MGCEERGGRAARGSVGLRSSDAVDMDVAVKGSTVEDEVATFESILEGDSIVDDVGGAEEAACFAAA